MSEGTVAKCFLVGIGNTRFKVPLELGQKNNPDTDQRSFLPLFLYHHRGISVKVGQILYQCRKFLYNDRQIGPDGGQISHKVDSYCQWRTSILKVG